MITDLFHRASLVAHLAESPSASHLDAMVLMLQKQGYAFATIKNCVRCADKFCEWLTENHIALTEINEDLLSRYTKGLPRRILLSRPRGIPHKHAGGLVHLVAALREAHLIPPLTANPQD